LYVNAEHDGKVGVVTIGRESYNRDVDAELNRALDWLKAANIENVIVTGDFHLSTQMVGADTAEFYPALEDKEKGAALAGSWSQTARRLHDDFKVTVGFINGKRCLGGMLELMMHCHYLVCLESASLGMPEVTLPVVPGMEGCHWPLRKTDSDGRAKLLRMLLTGENVRGNDAVGWLADYAGSMDDCLRTAWQIASDDKHGIKRRDVITDAIDLPEVSLPPASDTAIEGARKAVMACIRDSCSVPLSEALSRQARHSAEFMAGELCRKGAVGNDAARVLDI
jgi:enoyl-CoA hydratase/carnithine racemase